MYHICCYHHIALLLPWQQCNMWHIMYVVVIVIIYCNHGNQYVVDVVVIVHVKNILNWQNAKNRSNGIFGYYITSGTFWYIIHVLRKWHDIHTYSMISTKNLNIHTYSMISTTNLHRIRTTHTVKWGNDMIFAHMMNQWLVYYVGPPRELRSRPPRRRI